MDIIKITAFDTTVVTANADNPMLVDGRDLPRIDKEGYFKVTNIMAGKTIKFSSNAANVHQFLEDYATRKAIVESKWNFSWNDMAIAVNGQNLQDYHIIPFGGIVTITEGKNTSGK